MKRKNLFFILSVLASVFLFNVGHNAIATPYLITTYEGNLKQQDLDYINSIINTYNDSENTNLPNISPSSFPTVETLYEGDTEYNNYSFDGLENVDYLFIKAGRSSELWYVGDDSSFDWTSASGHALSNSATPAPVPEPGTIFMLGIGLMGIALLSKKKLYNK